MKKLVVVVEDEWSTRLQLVELIEGAGWVAKAFVCGDEALIEHHLLNPALLVTDINLPGSASGLDVAMRYRETFPDLPVIYCSGATPHPAQLVSGGHLPAEALRGKCAPAHHRRASSVSQGDRFATAQRPNDRMVRGEQNGTGGKLHLLLCRPASMVFRALGEVRMRARGRAKPKLSRQTDAL